MDEQLNVFIPITKVDALKREVWGVAAEEAPDKAGELMDYVASKPHFSAWSESIAKASDGKSLGNVRAMHQPVAAGKVISMQFDDDNRKVFVGTHIIDDNEWKKVEAGVYTGFSVGGSYGWRKIDGNVTRYEAKPSEISLVDNPCMRGATFTMVKVDGAEELVKFVGEPLAKAEGEAEDNGDKPKEEDADGNGASADEGSSDGDGEGDDVVKANTPQPELGKSDDPAWDASMAGHAVSDTASALQFLSTLAGNMASQFPAIAQRLAEAAKVVGKGLSAATAQLEAATSAAQEAKTAVDAVESKLDATIQAAVNSAMADATADEATIDKMADAVFAKFQLVINASNEQALAKAAGEKDALNKRFDAVTAELGAFSDRLAKVEARPAVAGPVLREVNPGASSVGIDAEMAVLTKLIEDERDPVMRQALQSKLSLIQIRAVQNAGGTRINP